MTLLSLEKIVGDKGYYIDDEDLKIYSFKYKKYTDGKLLKPHIYRDGYIYYSFSVNGKLKNILYHIIIVKMFINPNFDSTKEEIDHLNHNRQDNRIENLCVVSRIENGRNISKSWNGKEFNFVDNIGRSLTINEEAQIYYSLEFDKFYMYISHTNKYKELHEYLNNGCSYVHYSYKNKLHFFNVNKFKKSLNKK